MAFFLALQVTYQHLEVGIFNQHDLLAYTQKDKHAASTYLTFYLDEVLAQSHITLDNISFIAACQGPAPFTSLRTLLSSVNGIAFARSIPLIGIDGLQSFVHEHHKDSAYTIAIFNAFADEAYFAILSPQGNFEGGYESVYTLIPRIIKIIGTSSAQWIGDGVFHFNHVLKEHGILITTDKTIPTYLSYKELGRQAYTLFLQQCTKKQLLPLYLKQPIYKPSASL